MRLSKIKSIQSTITFPDPPEEKELKYIVRWLRYELERTEDGSKRITDTIVTARGTRMPKSIQYANDLVSYLSGCRDVVKGSAAIIHVACSII